MFFFIGDAMWSVMTTMLLLSQLLLKGTIADAALAKKKMVSYSQSNKDNKTCSDIPDNITYVMDDNSQEKTDLQPRQQRRQPMKILKSLKKRAAAAFRRLCCCCCQPTGKEHRKIRSVEKIWYFIIALCDEFIRSYDKFTRLCDQLNRLCDKHI